MISTLVFHLRLSVPCMDWPQPPRPGLRPTLATVTAPAVCGASGDRGGPWGIQRRFRLEIPWNTSHIWFVHHHGLYRSYKAYRSYSDMYIYIYIIIIVIIYIYIYVYIYIYLIHIWSIFWFLASLCFTMLHCLRLKSRRLIYGQGHRDLRDERRLRGAPEMFGRNNGGFRWPWQMANGWLVKILVYNDIS